MNFPTPDQIQTIVTTTIRDTCPTGRFSSANITEIGEAVAAAVSRWHQDTEAAPGSLAHYLLNKLAPGDTLSLAELAGPDYHPENIAACLDNLLVADYLTKTTAGYTITARGMLTYANHPPLRRLYGVAEQVFNRQVIAALYGPATLTYGELCNALELGEDQAAMAELTQALNDLTREGYTLRVTQPGITAYALTDAGRDAARHLR